jgi:hypothetical protein
MGGVDVERSVEDAGGGVGLEIGEDLVLGEDFRDCAQAKDEKKEFADHGGKDSTDERSQRR